ncbi:MAG: hypothetical protein AB8B51_11915 [Sedimentitalea sp.]
MKQRPFKKLIKHARRLYGFVAISFGFCVGIVGIFLVNEAQTRAALSGFEEPPWWHLAWVLMLGFGIWRYGLRPAKAIARVRGWDETRHLLVRIFGLVWPFGLALGAVLVLFSFGSSLLVKAVTFLAMVYVWDWLLARSRPKLHAFLS